MYYDNPYLPDEYITWLKSLEGVLAAMWREGDWDTFAGMALPMWNSAIHVIDPIFLPEYFPRWRSVDWGFASPYVGHWFARDLDTKRIYVYRETDAKMLTDAQQATQMKYLTPSNEFITATYADPHMWGRKS